MTKFCVVLIFCLSLFGATSCFAVPEGGGATHAQVKLVTQYQSIRPGAEFLAGLHFVLEEGWHLYWRNPGDSGLPLKAKWRLPSGFTAGEVEWPYPAIFRVEHLADYGYAGEVLLPLRIKSPLLHEYGKTVEIGVELEWVICKSTCIPGKASLSSSLSIVEEGAGAKSASYDLFVSALERLPIRGDALHHEAQARGKEILLYSESGPGHELPGKPGRFFPYQPGLISAAAPQVLEQKGAGYALRLQRTSAGNLPAKLEGVLVYDAATGGGRPAAYEVAARLEADAGDAVVEPQDDVVAKASPDGLPWEKFSRERLRSLLNQGVPVLIKFHADWCPACQVNQARLYKSPEIRSMLLQRRVTLLSADWTKRDPVIAETINSYGQAGLPLVVYYPGYGAPAVILPGIIEPEAFKRIIEGGTRSKPRTI